MRILSRIKKHPAITDTEVTAIQERVKSLRGQIRKREVELADLFALLAEDERPVLREMQAVRRPELQRFWPAQVPSGPALPPEAEAPKATYEWHPGRLPGLPTTP